MGPDFFAPAGDPARDVRTTSATTEQATIGLERPALRGRVVVRVRRSSREFNDIPTLAPPWSSTPARRRRRLFVSATCNPPRASRPTRTPIRSPGRTIAVIRSNKPVGALHQIRHVEVAGFAQLFERALFGGLVRS